MRSKKKLFLCVACLTAVAVAAVGGILIGKKIMIGEYKNMIVSFPKGFTCTAHTGCMNTPENSLESIEIAVASGADIVEFDLNFTAEGEPVLAHDAPKGGEVTLDEAFKKVSEYNDIKVNVDIKSTLALEKVKPLAEKYGILDRIFYTGVDDDFVDAVRTYGGDIPYYLNVDVEPERKQSDEYLNSLVDKVKESGAIGINFNKGNATKALVDKFHSNGLLVSIWTVNSETEIYRILSYAPDNITSRNPDKLLEAINSVK